MCGDNRNTMYKPGHQMTVHYWCRVIKLRGPTDWIFCGDFVVTQDCKFCMFSYHFGHTYISRNDVQVTDRVRKGTDFFNLICLALIAVRNYASA